MVLPRFKTNDIIRISDGRRLRVREVITLETHQEEIGAAVYLFQKMGEDGCVLPGMFYANEKQITPSGDETWHIHADQTVECIDCGWGILNPTSDMNGKQCPKCNGPLGVAVRDELSGLDNLLQIGTDEYVEDLPERPQPLNFKQKG